MKRMIIVLLAGILFALGIGQGFAQDYPSRQIEIIIPFPPGGALDTVFRIFQSPLAAALGVPIFLTTKGGAAGALGTDYVAKAKPDGYTLLAGTSSSLLVAVAVNAAITYRYQDFTPIHLLASDPILICSLPEAPWKNLDELVDHARKNPGKLSYGSTGMGTTSFFTMELFKLSYGLDIVPVHFQGSGPVKTAILGGHVNLCSTTFGPMASLVKSGKITPLVTSALERIPDYPEIPTLVERGFADASMNMWMGLFAPAKCPRTVVEKLVGATAKAIKDPSIAAQLRKTEVLSDYRTGEETLKLIEKDWKMINQVVQKLGIGK